MSGTREQVEGKTCVDQLTERQRRLFEAAVDWQDENYTQAGAADKHDVHATDVSAAANANPDMVERVRQLRANDGLPAADGGGEVEVEGDVDSMTYPVDDDAEADARAEYGRKVNDSDDAPNSLTLHAEQVKRAVAEHVERELSSDAYDVSVESVEQAGADAVEVSYSLRGGGFGE